jgi:TRAP-type C4-dicarboxylate transport system permease small subunit
MKKIIVVQFCVLLCGTLFAWGNFIWELVNWLNKKACTLGCAEPGINPFLTPCFYGALFFTLAFVLSILILRGSRAAK